VQSSLVKPTAFYSDDSEKIKLNWFCYEYALEIISEIGARLQKRLNQKGVPDGRIAEFAICFAKHMKAVALQKLGGEFDKVPMSSQDIARFLPHLDDRLVDDLLTVTVRAWEGLLEICSFCPARCISERDHVAPMFDAPDL
jgi:hypothetical protein